jgi:hypothetical protein
MKFLKEQGVQIYTSGAFTILKEHGRLGLWRITRAGKYVDAFETLKEAKQAVLEKYDVA